MKITRKMIREYKKDATPMYKAIASIILRNSDGYEDIEDFFSDLFHNGCSSGMISEAIYYSDTHKFAKKHIEEILEMKEEMEQDLGEPIQTKDDQLNWLCWFAIEEGSRKIYQSLGGENW